MTERQVHNQRIAAARTGMSERTARRFEKDPRKPSERVPERGRTVPDPLERVWEAELVPMLQTDPRLRLITLLHYLQRAYPAQFPDDRVRRPMPTAETTMHPAGAHSGERGLTRQ